MPIGRKVLLYLVLPVFLIGVVGFVGVTSIGRLGKAADDILSSNYHTIRQSRRMERILRQIELERGKPGDPPVMVRSFDTALTECTRSVTEPDETKILGQTRQRWTKLRRLLLDGQAASGAQVAGIFGSLHELVGINERAMFAYERKTARTARILNSMMVSSLVAAALGLIIFALVAARRISRPIVDVANRLHRALQDEHESPVRGAPADDEISRLRDELEDLLARLARYEDRLSRRLLEVQRRLAFVIDRIDDGLLLLDHDLEVLAVNRVGRQLVGLEDGDGRGNTLHTLTIPEGVARALEPILRGTAHRDGGPQDVRHSIGGSDRVYRVKIIPFEDTAPQGGGFLVLFWDVTEEREFQEAREQFIATMSHQLKTPITSLSMAINLMWERRRKRGGEPDEMLEIARSDCASVAAIVTELVDISRSLATAMKLDRRPSDLVGLVRRTLRSLQAEANARGVAVEDCIEQPSLEMDLDPAKFPWVISNIVGNALRYTPPSGRVSIALEHFGDHVEIVIADTGSGIEANKLERMFLPFVSLDQRSGSLGLGLAIARRVIKGHGGTVSVESECGKGTTFRISLPRGGLEQETDRRLSEVADSTRPCEHAAEEGRLGQIDGGT